METFLTFGNKQLAGLSKLHSNSPQIHFDANVFWNSVFHQFGAFSEIFSELPERIQMDCQKRIIFRQSSNLSQTNFVRRKLFFALNLDFHWKLFRHLAEEDWQSCQN